MDPKNAILILGLLAMVLLISSQVSARDLAETSPNTEEEVVEKSNEVNDAKYGHYGGGHYGGGHYGGGHYGGGGGHGGHYGGGHGASDNGN
ncbi:hypothetical protein RYX36_006076 [Vicia faba]